MAAASLKIPVEKVPMGLGFKVNAEAGNVAKISKNAAGAVSCKSWGIPLKIDGVSSVFIVDDEPPNGKLGLSIRGVDFDFSSPDNQGEFLLVSGSNYAGLEIIETEKMKTKNFQVQA